MGSVSLTALTIQAPTAYSPAGICSASDVERTPHQTYHVCRRSRKCAYASGVVVKAAGDEKERQAMARTKESLPSGVWLDTIRTAGKTESSTTGIEGEGEGDEGRKGSRATETDTGSQGEER